MLNYRAYEDFEDFEAWLHEHYDFWDVESAFTREELDELFEQYDREMNMITMGLLFD